MTDPRLSVAPMMDWTDRHERYFLRLITRHTLLYTEMVTAAALYHGDADALLCFDPAEHPVALQLGGSDPALLARATRLSDTAGYDEINLNVGCPSDRVQAGRFGACLMAEPERVADCLIAMREQTDKPVTVKCRIGIDDCDDTVFLDRFVRCLAATGTRRFIVHARKAWLSGLSPRENREIPPLRYERVYALKADHPSLTVCLNGGVTSLDAAAEHLRRVDGVMIGRAAYRNPFLLRTADRRFFGSDQPASSRRAIVQAFLPYVEARRREGVPLQAMTRHLLGLYQGVPGARRFRRYLSENAHRPGAGPEVLEAALTRVTDIEAPAPTMTMEH